MSNPEMGGYTPEQTESKVELPKPRFMAVADTKNAPKPMELEYKDNELVIITGEDAENYYGRGHLGLKGNIVEQKFPKASLRELSQDELTELSSKTYHEPPLGAVQYELSPTGEIERLKPVE